MTLRRKFPEGRLEVECDPALMIIVFINLLGNAVKYGNEGGAIGLSLESGPILRARVTNEGPGFQEHERNLLFPQVLPASPPPSSSPEGFRRGTLHHLVDRESPRREDLGRLGAGAVGPVHLRIPQPLSADLGKQTGSPFSEESP